MNVSKNKITPLQVLTINNTLRSLGLNTSTLSAKLLNKAIQYVIINDIEFINLTEIYAYLGEKYNMNINTIKNNVNNALTNRNKTLSIKNFGKIFGYEYSEEIFTPKYFIDEIRNIIS